MTTGAIRLGTHAKCFEMLKHSYAQLRQDEQIESYIELHQNYFPGIV